MSPRPRAQVAKDIAIGRAIEKARVKREAAEAESTPDAHPATSAAEPGQRQGSTESAAPPPPAARPPRRRAATATSESAPATRPSAPRRSQVNPAGSTEAPPSPKSRRKAAAPAKRLSSAEMVEKVVELVKGHDQPRSTVTIDVGPRGQVQPRVTIVTGEAPERVDAMVLKACSVADYLIYRYNVQLATEQPDGDPGRRP